MSQVIDTRALEIAERYISAAEYIGGRGPDRVRALALEIQQYQRVAPAIDSLLEAIKGLVLGEGRPPLVVHLKGVAIGDRKITRARIEVGSPPEAQTLEWP